MKQTAIEILNKLESLGGEALIVGGSVRDMILGHEPHDFDIATNIPISKIETIFNCHDIGANKTFGIICVNVNGFTFEIANYRTDAAYTDGRHPDSVKIVKSFKEDSARRDLTINALGMDKNGNIIDHWNGQNDIKNRIVRMVGNPFERLREDKLRLLRVVRFAVKLDFEIDPITFDAIKQFAKDLNQISPERIRDELFKMADLGGVKFAKAITLLDETGLLMEILPEIVKLKECEHNPIWHPEGPTAWEHTLAALKQCNSPDALTNISILLHDVGKTVTKTYNEEGTVQYLAHDVDGIPVIDDICNRLKLANDQRETVTFCARNHMRLHLVHDMRPSRIYEIIRNKNFEVFMEVGKADCLARITVENCHSIIQEWVAVEDRIEEIRENMKPSEFETLRKLLDGNIIMAMLNIKPSKQLGEIITKTMEWAIDNNVKDSETLYNFIRENNEVKP